MNTADHMIPDNWTDAQTGEKHHDLQYDGPNTWLEQDDSVVCSLVWDDMWLTKGEVRGMMDRADALAEKESRGVKWEGMAILWRDDIQHHVMTVPLYPSQELHHPEKV